jgi:hypothetical protein
MLTMKSNDEEYLNMRHDYWGIHLCSLLYLHLVLLCLPKKHSPEYKTGKEQKKRRQITIAITCSAFKTQ